MQLGHYDQAIPDYDTAISLKPEYAKAYYNRGIAKNSLSYTNEAQADFQIALNLAEKTKNESLKTRIKKRLAQE